MGNMALDAIYNVIIAVSLASWPPNAGARDRGFQLEGCVATTAASRVDADLGCKQNCLTAAADCERS